jgi:hypothetical protein
MSEWKKNTVNVSLRCTQCERAHEERVPIEALCRDGLAVHRCILGWGCNRIMTLSSSRWTLTHAYSGLTVETMLHTQREAMDLAEKLFNVRRWTGPFARRSKASMAAMDLLHKERDARNRRRAR